MPTRPPARGSPPGAWNPVAGSSIRKHYHGPLLARSRHPALQAARRNRLAGHDESHAADAASHRRHAAGVRAPAVAQALRRCARCCWPPPSSRPRRCWFITAGCSSTRSLLVLFGMLALVSLTRQTALRASPGFLIGLMFATKESFAISIIAWIGARACCIALENRESWIARALARRVAEYRMPVAVSLLTAAVTAGLSLHRWLPPSAGSHRCGPHLLRL